MGLLRLLPERRTIDASMFNINLGEWTSTSVAGVSVDADVAMEVPTFAACVLRKQDAFMAMPVDAYITEGDRRIPVDGPGWLSRPNEDDLWEQFVGAVSNALELSCHGACIAVGRDSAGRPVELRVLDRTVTRVTRSSSGRKVFEYDGREFPGEVIQIRRSPDDRSSLRSLTVIDLNRELFATAIAVQRYAASYFGSGGVPPFLFQMDGPVPSDKGAVDDLSRWWKTARRKGGFHAPGFVWGGKPIPLGADVEKSQLTSVQNALGVQIATLSRVPTHFVGLGVQGDSVKYENVVAAWVGFVRESLLTPMRLIERTMSDPFHMLMPTGQRMRFRTEVFEKPDTKGRYEIYQIGIDAGFLTVDDVRAWEDLAPLPDEPDEPEVNAEADEARSALRVAEEENRTLRALSTATVAAPAAPQISFTLPDSIDVPAPVVNVTVPDFPVIHVPTPVVNVTVPEPKPRPATARRVIRDSDGRIVRVIDEGDPAE